jgi:methyl-accepting chemotaxis protein
MPDSAQQHKVRPALRWKLCGTVALLIVGVVALFLVLVRDAVQRFVRHDEIERLRAGAVVELKQRCTDYLTSRDRQDVEKLMASLVAKHDQLAYICFVDSALKDDALLSSPGERNDELLALATSDETVPPDGRVRRVGGEAVVDIVETTPTRPAYTLHLGLRSSAVDERTRDLFVKMTVIAAVIAGGAVAVGFGLIVLIAGPAQTLASDATRLSLGDMRVRFRTRGRGELGRLADALDRLKESVLCALKRAGKM